MSTRGCLAVVCALALLAVGCTADRRPQPQPAPRPAALRVVSVLPREGGQRARSEAMRAAVAAAVRARAGRAGPHVVEHLEVDSSDPGYGEEMQEGCEPLAERLVGDARVVAVVGPLASPCARFLIPALNQAGVPADRRDAYL